ncbi:hypothetical protein D1872_260590 [compost metagenome]
MDGDSVRIHLFHGFKDTDRLRQVQKAIAVIQLIGILFIDPPDNMAFQCRSFNDGPIFGKPALTAAVHRDHGDAVGGVSRLVEPIPASAVIAVEQRQARPLPLPVSRSHIFRVDSGSSYPGKI